MVSMSYRDPVTKALIELPMGCAGGGSPVGFVGPYMGSVAPNGWVIADGRAHNSPALRTLLGSDNTPDLRGRFILAASPTYAARTTGGEATHTLTEEEIPSHTHGTRRGGGGTEYPVHSTTEMSGGWTSLDTDARGGSQPHNNMPPYYAMVYIIKAFEESAKDGITLEEADLRYVNVAGDEMTGDLTVANGVSSSVYVRSVSQRLLLLSRDSDLTSYIVSSDENNVAKRPLTIQTSKLRLSGGAETPTDDTGVATKSYVDGRTRIWYGGATSTPGGTASVTFPAGLFTDTPGISVHPNNVGGLACSGPYIVSLTTGGAIFGVKPATDGNSWHPSAVSFQVLAVQDTV